MTETSRQGDDNKATTRTNGPCNLDNLMAFLDTPGNQIVWEASRFLVKVTPQMPAYLLALIEEQDNNLDQFIQETEMLNAGYLQDQRR